MDYIKLETERLVLRTINEDFADKVLQYYIDNSEFLREWEPERDDKFYTLDLHKRMLKGDAEAFKAGNSVRFWIFKKDDMEFKRIIGSIALSSIVRGCFQSCFLGYKLCCKETNKGYMEEALRAIVDYGFNVLKLHRIEGNIIPRNKASIRVVEKVGFIEEGLSKKYLKINGRWEDHIHFVLLNEKVE